MTDLCIWHGGCTDGFAAAYAVWTVAPNVEFHAGVYQKPPPANLKGKTVFLVDFSYPKSVILEMAKTAEGIVILDHHKSAMAEWLVDRECSIPGLTTVIDNIELNFDMERSGAVIAWNYFHARPAPRLLEHVQDQDLWRFAIPRTKEIIQALRSYPQDFEVWDKLMQQPDCADLYTEGVAIYRYFRQKIEELKEHAFPAMLAEHEVCVVNANYVFASELAGDLAKDAPFAASYYIGNGRVNYSLRSEVGKGIDVSEVAKQFGGGGHKHAAGFAVDLLGWNPHFVQPKKKDAA